MFSRCCNVRSTSTYEVVHKPKPIIFSEEMDKIVKNLLWYVPNIDSFQAEKNELIENKVYDDFSFTYIMNKVGIDEDRDVKWLEPRESFDEDDWHFYENEVCKNCQKIIITRCKSLSKTNDLLRCIRNCIAHGYFSVVDDYIVGFNKKTTQSNPDGIKKAIIKIKPKILLNALSFLISPRAKELLVGYAFERVGYRVVKPADKMDGYAADLCIEKGGIQYLIQIRDYKGIAYLHPEKLKDFLSLSEKKISGVEKILFIDTSKVTKAVRELESEIDGFRIIDLAQVKQLLGDSPVDILAQNG